MKRICVFCGSNAGANPAYLEAARLLARVLVERKIGLVYGGSSVGIMGELAHAVLENGGEVIGVIPSPLMAREKPISSKLADLRVVSSMHEKKALMERLSDGFIALPGGLGTLEEFFEIVTWAQLGMHEKPCGLLNVGHYYDKLLEFLQFAVDQQLINPVHCSMILMESEPYALLDRFESYQTPVVDKWINLNRT